MLQVLFHLGGDTVAVAVDLDDNPASEQGEVGDVLQAQEQVLGSIGLT